MGAGQYTDDVRDFVPDDETVYAAFVRSPHAHADVLGIDPQRALEVPGVLAALTAADYLADGGRPIAQMPIPADALDVRRPAFRGLDLPQPPFATDSVRYPGEIVAVVVARTPALARDAADLVEVTYVPQPAVVDVRDAVAAAAPLVWSAVGSNVAVDTVFGQPEAAERAFAQAAVTVELSVHSQRIVNCQMEPRAALASYDPVSEILTLVTGSQGVARQRSALAATLDLPPERIRVVCPDVGGGFGPRTNLAPEQVIVAWAARRLGRPVRWTSTRAEAFSSDLQGRDAQTTGRLALDAAGHILAISADWLLNVGAHTVSYVPLANAARILSSVYAIPAMAIHLRGVLTHTVPTGPYRGAGRPEATLLLERLLDLAAARLDLDRPELRRRNLIAHDQLPYTTAAGLTYDSGDFAGNMQRVLELADWAGFPLRQQAARARQRLAGIGLANYVEAPVGAPHEHVQLRILPAGTVELLAGTQSSGQGHATTFAQVAADELGLDPACVRLRSGDTALVPSGGGTHSDRSMRLAGTLIVEAAGRLRQQCRELGAELLGAELDAVTFANGAVSDGQSTLSLFELARRGPLEAEASFTGRLPAHPTGAAVCEVEIDPETGQLELVRYTSVDDVGQPINPRIVHGQIEGGIVQGLGQALGEGTVYDPANGQLLTSSFGDYAMPRAAGLPHFATELREDPTSGNPLRVKGGGEGGITPCMAAVVNAAVDALAPMGVEHLEMPLTPARLWSALANGVP